MKLMGKRCVSLICTLMFSLFTICGSAMAATETVLHSFAGSPTDGYCPTAGLIMDSTGNLYGTTQAGGADINGVCGSQGCGTIFKLDTSNTLTVLHSFTLATGTQPNAKLTMDSAGNIYGTAVGGGTYNAGTVFKLDTTGNLTVLHNFAGGADGLAPRSEMILDGTGNLYGTTVYGGANNDGTIYKVDTSGNLTILHSFTNANGAFPYGGLIMDSAGNFYGTTASGGLNNAGTVYKLDTNNNLTVLYRFGTTTKVGKYPFGKLVMDLAGNLYGTTSEGGSSKNAGVIFKLDTGNHLTVLYSFNVANGANPFAGLVRDSAGNLFGTTNSGGTNNMGTVFKLDTRNRLTVLHSFAGGADGLGSEGDLIMDSAGILYGTSENGGTNNFGTIFKIQQ